ncbi:DUF22 domain-containing protein [Candidatus Thorarchaeota archaeon]|nr:MAG: DUF22 domain-containing protein [Candidatus Thorarchaeota archaeon]
MTDKIYVISCNQELASMGLDRMRTSVQGLDPATLDIDWSNARLVPIVAAERVAFEEDETKMVSIQPIDVPANSIVLNSFYGSNGMGHLTCIGSTEMKPDYEKRTATIGMFRSRVKAPVMQNDLLGMALIVEAKRK